MASVTRCQTKSRIPCSTNFKLPSSKLRSSIDFKQLTIILAHCLVCQPSQVVKIGVTLICPWHTCMRTKWPEHKCSEASIFRIHRQCSPQPWQSILKIGSKSVFHLANPQNFAKGTNNNRKDSVLEWKEASIRLISEQELLALATSLTYSTRIGSFQICPIDPKDMLYQP